MVNGVTGVILLRSRSTSPVVLGVESLGPVGRHALSVACEPRIELLENAGLAEPRLGLEDDHLGSLGSPYPVDTPRQDQ